MQMTMVVFNRLRGALESLRMSTDVSYIAGFVEARIEGRLKRRLSRKTVEYRPDLYTGGEAVARNDRHALAFTEDHPNWSAPAVAPGIMTYWVRVEVPRTLLSGLAADFKTYHGFVPWEQYSAAAMVPLWVAMPILAGWDVDGRPVYMEVQPEPDPGPVCPPLEVPPPPQWPEREPMPEPQPEREADPRPDSE